MTSKWAALGLIVLGAALVAWALRFDKKASFDDGTFLLEMAALVGGGAMVVVGLEVLAAALFTRL